MLPILGTKTMLTKSKITNFHEISHWLTFHCKQFFWFFVLVSIVKKNLLGIFGACSVFAYFLYYKLCKSFYLNSIYWEACFTYVYVSFYFDIYSVFI